MAEVVTLANKPVIVQPSAVAKAILGALDDIAKRAAQEELKGVLVVGLGYDNLTHSQKIWSYGDSLALLGTLDVLKDEILQRMHVERDVDSGYVEPEKDPT